jgi:hypothetical protein
MFEEDQRLVAACTHDIGEAMLHRERVVVGDDAGPEEGDAGSQTAVLSALVSFSSDYHNAFAAEGSIGRWTVYDA